ncbi:TRAP transporter small permease [Maridesulfovibrio sp.]|uniref:TRAP transporter small permease n=1 Tax=Maridesulfovibrio sp. TaxID=2795000 RepID=UPI002A18758E|nr:TRAP transporter small permease [Maridesulfovibrio sp.]
MDKLFEKLRAVLYWISVTSMTVMLALIFFQVVTRYFFGHTFEWSEELARFLFVWVVFLGSALIMGESGHLAVQILPTRLKGSASGLLLEIFINLCSYAFTMLLLVQGAKMTSVMTFQVAPGLGISMSVVYSIIPISAFLMILYLIKDTVKIISRIREHCGSAAISDRKAEVGR